MEGELTSEEAAKIAGVARQTFAGYVARGQAPKPTRHVGRTPVWSEAEILEWMKTRPGRGFRGTDRALRRAADRAAGVELPK